MGCECAPATAPAAFPHAAHSASTRSADSFPRRRALRRRPSSAPWSTGLLMWRTSSSVDARVAPSDWPTRRRACCTWRVNSREAASGAGEGCDARGEGGRVEERSAPAPSHRGSPCRTAAGKKQRPGRRPGQCPSRRPPAGLSGPRAAPLAARASGEGWHAAAATTTALRPRRGSRRQRGARGDPRLPRPRGRATRDRLRAVRARPLAREASPAGAPPWTRHPPAS